MIERGAPRDSPFPIFLARARDQTVIHVQRPKITTVRAPPLVLKHDFDRAFVSVRWISARPNKKPRLTTPKNKKPRLTTPSPRLTTPSPHDENMIRI